MSFIALGPNFVPGRDFGGSIARRRPLRVVEDRSSRKSAARGEEAAEGGRLGLNAMKLMNNPG